MQEDTKRSWNKWILLFD